MTEQINAVQRMQDYMENHLDERITLADLSRASLFSPWHSYRLFKLYTALTPADYLRRLRLSRSALRLRDGCCAVTEVALELGFGSVDGYRRAFFREFGCNPGEYAARPVPLRLFTPYGVRYSLLRKESSEVEEVKSIFIQLTERPPRKVILKRGVRADSYFPYCEEVGCEVWGLLTSMKSLAGEPVCLYLPKAYRPEGTSEYVQGVEVALEDQGEIPEGFDVIELPAASYLMFQGEPFCEEDYGQAIAQLQRAIQRYNPAALGYEWDHSQPRIQLEPIGERGYIELWPVRPLRR